MLGALIGDPARSNMLTALMSGKALTPTELSQEAGITPQTASSHLARLQEGGLLTQVKQGRHRYFSLAGEDVAALLENLMGIASRRGHTRTRTGPRDPALRRARVCYDHLAGEMAVRMFDSLSHRGMIQVSGDLISLSETGNRFMADFGINVDILPVTRRPLCRPCLDWSARRSHLAGSLGASLYVRIQQLGWARREAESRAVTFTRRGEQSFNGTFPNPE